MKRILSLSILLGISLLFACNSGVKHTESNDPSASAEDGRYGERIAGNNPISGVDLLTMLTEKDSVWVTLRSTIAANCQSSGCWMDLDLGSGQVAKVTFKDYAFFIPLDSKGKTATIEGFAKKEVIPVELLKHYAEDEGKSQEEIDAITEPEQSYIFEAIGVIIEA